MPTSFVVLTGASGVGKTSIAQAIEELGTGLRVYQGDRIRLPSEEIMAGYGHTDEPGGDSQRGFALYWIGVISNELKEDTQVLLETQCRIAFLHEALALHGVSNAHIILVECSDESREGRLRERGHPELANEQMSNWSRFLHCEAESFGDEIWDTTHCSLQKSVARVLDCFQPDS